MIRVTMELLEASMIINSKGDCSNEYSITTTKNKRYAAVGDG
jgi:hypothetical protein